MCSTLKNEGAADMLTTGWGPIDHAKARAKLHPIPRPWAVATDRGRILSRHENYEAADTARKPGQIVCRIAPVD